MRIRATACVILTLGLLLGGAALIRPPGGERNKKLREVAAVAIREGPDSGTELPSPTTRPERKAIDPPGSEWAQYLAQYRREGEIPALRDAYARHFANADGTVEARISTTPIHYPAEDASWQEIDPRVLAVEDGYANQKNNLKSHFPRRSTGRTTVGLGSGRSYHWAPKYVGYDGSYVVGRINEVEGRAEGEEVRYEGIFPGATDRYTIHPGEVKHDLVLESRPTLPGSAGKFEYVGEMELGEDLSFFVDGTSTDGDFDTSGAIELRDGRGNRLFQLHPVVAVETRGSARVSGSYEVRHRVGRVYEMRLAIPAAWLLDPVRKYPILLDPTTSLLQSDSLESGGVRFHGGIVNEAEWSSNVQGANGYPLGRDYDWADETYRIFISWRTWSVPAWVTIQNVAVNPYIPQGNYAEFDRDSVQVLVRSLDRPYVRSSPGDRYKDCGDGILYATDQWLYAGDLSTRWIHLSSNAGERFGSQDAGSRFGIGLKPQLEGDRGILVRPHWSTLRVVYSPEALTLAFVAPAHEARTTGSTVTFQWTPYWSPASGPALYVLYCDTVPSPTRPVYVGSSTSFTWRVPDRSVRYYWRVAASAPAITSHATTAIRWFLPNGIPDTPRLLAPGNGASVPPGQKTLHWTQVADPDGDPVFYEWQVDTTYPLQSPFSDRGVTSNPSAVFEASPNTLYYVRVRVYDGYEWTPWGPVSNFGTP